MTNAADIDENMRPVFPLQRLVGPAPDKPTKAELIHRRRGEVCALGRLLRALDKEPSCNAHAVAQKHYSKAMRILKETHQTPNAQGEPTLKRPIGDLP